MTTAEAIISRVIDAFPTLRAEGYDCRRKFMCCSSYAGAALPEGTERWVYWHEQDHDTAWVARRCICAGAGMAGASRG
jgi:hypothetical protein